MASVRCHSRISNRPFNDRRFGLPNTNTQNPNTQNRLPQLAMYSFKVQVCVWHGFSSDQSHSIPVLIPLSGSCFELSCHSFFGGHGRILLQRKLSHPSIPPEYVSDLASNAMDYARRVLQIRRRRRSNRSSGEIPLALDVFVQTCSDEDSENDMMEWIIWDSEEEVRMIPASKEAVQELLETLKFEGNDEMNNCSICFEEFNEGEDVSEMPCRHVYHQDCIVQWLEKSHMCPLCRHPLPKSD